MMDAQNPALSPADAGVDPTPAPRGKKPPAALPEGDRPTSRPLMAADFPESPYMEQVDKLRDEALAAQARRAKEAKATKPWEKTRSLVRRDMFAVGSQEMKERLAARGLEVCFIREDEVDEYLDLGYRIARKSDVGGLRDKTAQDSEGADGVLRRREMIGVIGRVEYRADRQQVEEARAVDQLGDQDREDKLLGLTGLTQRVPGRFGRQPRRLGVPKLPNFDNDDE